MCGLLFLEQGQSLELLVFSKSWGLFIVVAIKLAVIRLYAFKIFMANKLVGSKYYNTYCHIRFLIFRTVQHLLSML
jgi:hypothetical protein